MKVDNSDIENLDGEHPSVVLADICRRPEIHARIIVFANEKGGVGKSTLAFHTCIALARTGHKVLAIDLDRRQRSLQRALENREATTRSLGVDLPTPQHLVLEHQSGAMLGQEIARVGANCDTIIIDVPGHDSPIARRAIAMADKLITPVNPTFVDLDSIARFTAGTLQLTKLGPFAQTVTQLRQARIDRGLKPADWLLVKNRVRRAEKRQLARFNRAIGQLPRALDLHITNGLTERVAYRDLFLFGLTHADCAGLPGLANIKVHADQEMDELLEELGIVSRDQKAKITLRQAHTPARSMERHRQALRRQIGATKRISTNV